MSETKFSDLLGKTLASVIGRVGDDEIIFETIEGEKYKLYHCQDCCESVSVEVAVLHKVTGMKGRIGAAWQNQDGSISIVLNPLVMLTADPQLVVTLFKKQESGFRQPDKRTMKARSTGSEYEPNADHQDYIDSLKRNREME